MSDSDLVVDEASNLLQHTAREAQELWEDFEEFIDNGNVVELSIGVILGGAFTKIVDSIVNDMFAPVLGLMMGSQLKNSFILLKQADREKCLLNGELIEECKNFKTPLQAQKYGAVTWNYGNLLQNIINFFITAAFLFVTIKVVRLIIREKTEKEKASCTFCLSKININAKKCKFCGSNQ